MLDNFWLGTIVLPLFAILLKAEIADIYKSWTVFKARSFDEDRDPNTPDRCQVYNEASGEWEDVLILCYAFSLDKNKRGVFVLHPVDGQFGLNKQWAAERIALTAWADMRKRHAPALLDPALEAVLTQRFASSRLNVDDN